MAKGKRFIKKKLTEFENEINGKFVFSKLYSA